MMKLFKKEVKDTFLQENFKRIQNEYNDNPFVKGEFKFFEMTFGKSTSSFPFVTVFEHNLGFQPQDIIQTSAVGGTVTWNYTSFSKTTISVTVSAVTTARFFAGRYEEGSTA